MAPRAAISRGRTHRSPVPRFHCSLPSSDPGDSGRDARAAYHRSAGRAGHLRRAEPIARAPGDPAPGPADLRSRDALARRPASTRRGAPPRFVRQSSPMDPRRGDRPAQVRPRPPSTGRPAPVRTRPVTPSPARLSGYRRIERRARPAPRLQGVPRRGVVVLGGAILWVGSGQVGPFVSGVVRGFGGFVSQVGAVAGAPAHDRGPGLADAPTIRAPEQPYTNRDVLTSRSTSRPRSPASRGTPSACTSRSPTRTRSSSSTSRSARRRSRSSPAWLAADATTSRRPSSGPAARASAPRWPRGSWTRPSPRSRSSRPRPTPRSRSAPR